MGEVEARAVDLVEDAAGWEDAEGGAGLLVGFDVLGRALGRRRRRRRERVSRALERSTSQREAGGREGGPAREVAGAHVVLLLRGRVGPRVGVRVGRGAGAALCRGRRRGVFPVEDLCDRLEVGGAREAARKGVRLLRPAPWDQGARPAPRAATPEAFASGAPGEARSRRRPPGFPGAGLRPGRARARHRPSRLLRLLPRLEDARRLDRAPERGVSLEFRRRGADGAAEAVPHGRGAVPVEGGRRVLHLGGLATVAALRGRRRPAMPYWTEAVANSHVDLEDVPRGHLAAAFAQDCAEPARAPVFHPGWRGCRLVRLQFLYRLGILGAQAPAPRAAMCVRKHSRPTVLPVPPCALGAQSC